VRRPTLCNEVFVRGFAKPHKANTFVPCGDVCANGPPDCCKAEPLKSIESGVVPIQNSSLEDISSKITLAVPIVGIFRVAVPQPNPNATPAGTYTVVVKATLGAAIESMMLTLTVQ